MDAVQAALQRAFQSLLAGPLAANRIGPKQISYTVQDTELIFVLSLSQYGAYGGGHFGLAAVFQFARITIDVESHDLVALGGRHKQQASIWRNRQILRHYAAAWLDTVGR